MQRIFTFTFTFFLIIWIYFVYAEVHLEIKHGINTIHSIGIMPFHWDGWGVRPENIDIDKIIIDDLHNSGKIRTIIVDNIKNYSDKVDILVSGKIKSENDGKRYLLFYKILDVYGKILLHNHYHTDKSGLRLTAHTISNDIFQNLTGIRGAFCTRIAYIRRSMDDENHRYLYLLCIADYDGYNPKIIYRSTEPLMSPAWSADGTKLAYVIFKKDRSSIVIQNLVNRSISPVTNYPCHNGAPTFSPDGKKLAFVLSKSGTFHLYVMDLYSGYIDQITRGYSNNTEPSWFPDSQTLAYTSDQSGIPQVYLININKKEWNKRLTWNPVHNQNPKVSYNGRFIIMVNRNAEKQQNILKMDLQTGQTFLLTTDKNIDENPSISPNDTMVAYSSIDNQCSKLCIISINGQYNKNCLDSSESSKGKITFPTWSPYL
ncbi:Tol-Pal system beta propeller repeat protein TolB [Candidatus Schneideria nysicola]|uniref:Tol-Pal system beta propeller repeat protein TolB n=1 Tax=Candidatus Schneideria nysicola TaxID=1081631 RepID=UPI001CAA80B9|nr:Tol-Pal system beta propeller repeat protein TolB [Candidatus Schneideria nysicola]UAJ65080.1 Tol-Pal system beta propeller repeat protein TolB [Candidatus Schneideria nysicola]